MKIVLDNGKEYNVAGVSGIETVARALLKEYGLTDEQVEASQHTVTANDVSGRLENTGSRVVMFNAQGDNITVECMPIGSDRPAVKAIYISDTKLALNVASQVVTSFTNDVATQAGLYVWNKYYDTWFYVDEETSDYFKYMADSFDCIANAKHALTSLGVSL